MLLTVLLLKNLSRNLLLKKSRSVTQYSGSLKPSSTTRCVLSAHSEMSKPLLSSWRLLISRIAGWRTASRWGVFTRKRSAGIITLSYAQPKRRKSTLRLRKTTVLRLRSKSVETPIRAEIARETKLKIIQDLLNLKFEIILTLTNTFLQFLDLELTITFELISCKSST